MFTESVQTMQPDPSILNAGGRLVDMENQSNFIGFKPVDDGANKIIDFVDKVTSVPQRIEMTARELNEYLIDVGEKISGESEKKARENLGSFKVGNKIQQYGETGVNWIRKNWMIAAAAAVVYFLIFRRK